MVVIQARSKRKASGGRYTSTLSKRKHMVGRRPALTKLDDKEQKRIVRTKGSGVKRKLLQGEKVNLTDAETKKTSVTEIEGVVQNPANRHFVRRNIITKGTIIETKDGSARVTNRPGQEGVINAVLLTKQ